MRFCWPQSGFSMVQGMVISSVLAGSALIATRMMTTQKMSMKSAETKDQIQELHKMIFGQLQNREHCLMTFGGVLTLTPGTAQTIPVTTLRTKANTGASVTTFQVNTGGSYDATTTYMGGNVRINSMSLQTTTNLGDPQPLRINYMRLEGSDANKRTKMGFGGKSITKTVYLRLQRASAASTAITGCYAVEMSTDSDTGLGNQDLNKEFCERLGVGGSLYTWDSTRNTCVLDSNICPAGQVFEGINSNGSPTCRAFSEYLPYFLKSGTNPCTGSKTSVAIVRDPVTNLVSIQCY